MTRWHGRSWSSSRVVVLAAWFIPASIALLMLVGLRGAVPALILGIIGDFVAVTYRRQILRGVDVALRATPGTVADTPATLTVILEADRPTSCLVLPALPSRIPPLESDAIAVMLLPNAPTAITFQLGPDAPGRYTAPGVVLRRVSPLRIFTASVLKRRRCVVDILPGALATHDPILDRAVGVSRPQGERHQRRGAVGEFSELRPYQYPEPVARADWKATARRGSLIIREYEEPRDFGIRIVLDASLDMTMPDGYSASFTSAADLVVTLAAILSQARSALTVTTYDRRVVGEHLLGRGPDAVRNLIAGVVALPSMALRRVAAEHDAEHVEQLLESSWRRSATRWSDESLDTWRDAYTAAGLDDVHLLTDIAPESARLLDERCRDCGAAMFPGETACLACEAGDDTLSPRALGAISALDRVTRHTHGREMLIFVSALRGGETHPLVAKTLAHARTASRRVHVVVPSAYVLDDIRPRAPGDMGATPSHANIAGDVHRLAEATRYRAFRDILASARVPIHPIERPHEVGETLRAIIDEERY